MNENSAKIDVVEEEAEFLDPLLISEDEITTTFRLRRKLFVEQGVRPADVPEYEAKGWGLRREDKRSSRIRKDKSHDKLLEDRVWCLFKNMGALAINDERFNISFKRRDGSIGKKQVDVYSEDDETAVVIECKSRADRGRRSLQKDLQETISLQSYFRNEINKRFKGRSKPIII